MQCVSLDGEDFRFEERPYKGAAAIRCDPGYELRSRPEGRSAEIQAETLRRVEGHKTVGAVYDVYDRAVTDRAYSSCFCVFVFNAMPAGLRYSAEAHPLKCGP